MAQQQSSSGILSSIVTILGLGLVWMTVVANFPSQEELTSDEAPAQAREAAGRSASQTSRPTLDLTIPTSPPLPSDVAMHRPNDERSRDSAIEASVTTGLDSSTVQATRLKCEAEIEQLCPESPDGSARARCQAQRAKRLPPPCQSQLQERFVKWREDRSRLVAACDEDIKRFCRVLPSGSGEILQCLQSHGQEVSDRCYQTFPKGTFFVK
ncbi:MAG: hypothetical protein CAF45_005805 [Nitrospira sp. CG24E]|nr:MAG: hypothetical protein CAF45_005805 [Nitrospira sp. CG24E]